MNNDCQSIRDQIADLVTGVLPESGIRQVQKHLTTCPACRDYMQALKQEDASLTRYFAAIDEDLANRQGHTLQVIECCQASKEANTIPIWRRVTISRYAKFAASATAIVAVVAAVILLSHAGNAPREHEPAGVVSAGPSGLALLTEISLERAFRRGGIEAVEDQYQRVLGKSRQEPRRPTTAEMLTGLAGDKNAGGTNP